jgi:hypothetical protein
MLEIFVCHFSVFHLAGKDSRSCITTVSRAIKEMILKRAGKQTWYRIVLGRRGRVEVYQDSRVGSLSLFSARQKN